MRAAESYRGARKREAKAAGLDWKALPRTANYRGDSVFVVTPNAGVTFRDRGNRRAKAVYEVKGKAAPRERLFGAAIRLPEGTISMPRGSHSDLRRAHKLEPDSFPELCGFLTSANRFVSRGEAVKVAVYAGQLSGAWLEVSRDLLSSDVMWDATP